MSDADDKWRGVTITVTCAGDLFTVSFSPDQAFRQPHELGPPVLRAVSAHVLVRSGPVPEVVDCFEHDHPIAGLTCDDYMVKAVEVVKQRSAH
jgi:hypothetical protein